MVDFVGIVRDLPREDLAVSVSVVLVQKLTAFCLVCGVSVLVIEEDVTWATA